MTLVPQRRFPQGAWLACLLAAAFCGCTGENNLPDPIEGTTDVMIQDMEFSPKNVTINRGERVRWTNNESGPMIIPHTTTSGDPGDPDEGAIWDSENLLPGQSFTQQFNEVGVFAYFCSVHRTDPDMRDATVTVVEPDVQP